MCTAPNSIAETDNGIIMKITSILLAGMSFAAILSCNGNTRADNASGGGKPTNDTAFNATDVETELYSYANSVIPSQYYSVKVNGHDATVIPGIAAPEGNQPDEEHQICIFGCAGEVLVEIVMLKPGDRAVVEINGKEDNDLFIFVNPLEDSKPSKDDPDVSYYEAGTVTDVGSMSIPSGHTVYIEGGAIVKGNFTCSQNSSDIAVKGAGIIDSRGVNARGIQFHKISNLTIDGVTMLNDINWSNLIAEGTDVSINNYKVVAVYNPENTTGCENDALDLLGCRNAVVKGCFGYAHDDIFCVKSHKWSYKGEVDNILFEDCIAWNFRSGNSFVVGAETNYDISGVTYRNCVSIHSAGNPSGTLNRGGLSVHHCAGGHVSDILFENIVLEDCKEYGIHIDIRKSYVSNLGNDDNNSPVPFSPGTADGIILRNVEILNTPPEGNFAFGYDASHRIEGLVFDNVRIAGTEITAANIETFFDPSMSYHRDEQTSGNLTNVEYSFE